MTTHDVVVFSERGRVVRAEALKTMTNHRPGDLAMTR
jgi:hypothetical protein